MKVSAVLFTAGLAAAQIPKDFPGCALKCLTTTVPKASSCKVTEFDCLCKKENFDKIKMAAMPCLQKECKDDELQKATDGANMLCANLVGGSSMSGGMMSSGSMTGSMTGSGTPSMTGGMTTPTGDMSSGTMTDSMETGMPTGSMTSGGAGGGMTSSEGSSPSSSAVAGAGPVVGAAAAAIAAALAL